MHPQMPPPERPLEVAADWLLEHAMFAVPEYKPPSDSASTSIIKENHAKFVVANAPEMAFYDKDMANRCIDALERAIAGKRLQLSIRGNNGLPNSEVRSKYEKLFHPGCLKQDDIPKDDWLLLTNEIVCNRLTHNALLFALKAVTFRLTDKEIYTVTEPLQPNVKKGKFDGTKSTVDTLKENVDFAVCDKLGNGRALFLIEGKTPNVLHGLAALLDGAPLIIDMNDQSGLGRKVLNEAIYYMYLWNIEYLVATCFEFSIILQLHEIRDDDEEVPVFVLSYSEQLDQNMDSKLFRTLLGMTLVQLDEAELDDKFDAKAAYDAWVAHRRAEADARVEARASRRGDRGGGGTKRTFEETIGRQIAASGADRNTSQRIARTMSKLETEMKFQEKVGREAPITHRGDSLYVSGLPLIARSQNGHLELERDSGVPFPNLPSTQIPCLKVVSYHDGVNGITYEAVLQNPDGSYNADKPNFVIKTVDASQMEYEKYRNSFEELVTEYKTYYLLALAKRAGKFNDVIEKFTPTCYGLYQGKSGFKGVFALVIDHVGVVDLNQYRYWSGSDKIAVIQSLLALHSLGLFHGDPDERNVAIRRKGAGDTYRFFDFGNSHWHRCLGITDCEELKVQLRILYNMHAPPWNPIDLQERTIREYALPFCNLEEVVDGMESLNYEPVVLRLRRRGKMYDTEYTQSQ
ncbi:hypothetical protein ACEPAF_3030 [Sanghuangporus sanghuang]